MKKQISKIKIQIKACEATPSPPIGPALGAKGINIMKFCKEFNDKTTKNGLQKGTMVTTIITIYSDKSFDFIIKTPITSSLIKNILNITKGSSFPNKNKIAKITISQIKEIVDKKKNDLFINSEQASINTIIGTAKSMGITIEEK